MTSEKLKLLVDSLTSTVSCLRVELNAIATHNGSAVPSFTFERVLQAMEAVERQTKYLQEHAEDWLGEPEPVEKIEFIGNDPILHELRKISSTLEGICRRMPGGT